MKDFSPDNLDSMTPAEFEEYLPELFEAGNGKVSDDPRFAKFLASNPDCAALVRDLETIAETAAWSPATRSGRISRASCRVARARKKTAKAFTFPPNTVISPLRRQTRRLRSR
jgi:hypothetical protein